MGRDWESGRGGISERFRRLCVCVCVCVCVCGGGGGGGVGGVHVCVCECAGEWKGQSKIGNALLNQVVHCCNLSRIAL